MTGAFRIHMVRIYPVSRPLVFSRCFLLSGHDFSLRLKTISHVPDEPGAAPFQACFYICRDVENGGIHPLSSTLRHNISIVLNFLSSSSKFRQMFQIVKSIRSEAVRPRLPRSMDLKSHLRMLYAEVTLSCLHETDFCFRLAFGNERRVPAHPQTGNERLTCSTSTRQPRGDLRRIRECTACAPPVCRSCADRDRHRGCPAGAGT